MVALYRHHKEMPAMNIAELKTPPHCSADDSAASAAAPAAPAAPAGKTEVGFTLQTLIVMAVFVLAAVGVGIGLLAVTSASSDDFEEAGQTGVEARCAPNEIWNPELESRGIGGPDSQGGIKSKQVGCEPYCGTWEFLSTGANENGEYEPAESPAAARQSSIGGPDGNGGVYSQNTGCFAPCYWSYTNGVGRPDSTNGFINSGTSLQYLDDNRAPAIRQIRLGVNYRRAAEDRSTDLYPGAPSGGGSRWRSDLQASNFSLNRDGKPFIIARSGRGSAILPGETPLTPALLQWVPAVFEPNLLSRNADPGATDPTQRNGTRYWEDENWEYRADPYERECSIVNMHPNPGDNPVKCSSEWPNCGTPS